jgi:hypothetical protein
MIYDNEGGLCILGAIRPGVRYTVMRHVRELGAWKDYLEHGEGQRQGRRFVTYRKLMYYNLAQWSLLISKYNFTHAPLAQRTPIFIAIPPLYSNSLLKRLISFNHASRSSSHSVHHHNASSSMQRASSSWYEY